MPLRGASSGASSPRSTAPSTGCGRRTAGGSRGRSRTAPRSSGLSLRSSLRSVALIPLLGRDFFPTVDAGLIKLHVRGSPGTRLEESERRFARIQETIRAALPPGEIRTMLDSIGIPASGINLSLSEGAQISSADGQIFIALAEHHRPTADHVRALRAEAQRGVPRHDVLLPRPRHLDAGAELRPARRPSTSRWSARSARRTRPTPSR